VWGYNSVPLHVCKKHLNGRNAYQLKISTDKTKIMAFKGKNLVRSKIEIDGLKLEKVKQFIILVAN
jgi:hypothetical protein